MEFGSAVHSIVLESGAEIETVDAKSWLGKTAQAERIEIRASGRIALLPHEFQAAHAIAARIRRHPVASALFDPERGIPERSLFWRDEESGVMLRARPDWLPEPVAGERLIVPDLKTTGAVDPESIARTMAKFNYGMQGEFYERGIRALGIARDVVVLFVFVMRAAPYLIQVVGVPEVDRSIAAAKNRRAIEVFAQCSKSGIWPGFEMGHDVAYIDVPGWAQSRDAQEYL